MKTIVAGALGECVHVAGVTGWLAHGIPRSGSSHSGLSARSRTGKGRPGGYILPPDPRNRRAFAG